MAHYAFLNKNNVVTEVITGKNENEITDEITNWEDYYSKIRGQKCLRTSYNTFANKHLLGGIPLRKNFAGIGYTYDPERDAFIAPKPFTKWVLNEETCQWEAPIPHPADDKQYVWNDNQGKWEEVVID